MNNNLYNLIATYRKDGLTYDQILSVLLGMGMVEEIVREHIDIYSKVEKGRMKPYEHDARGMEVETPSEDDVWGKANTVDRDVESMNKRYFNKNIKENAMNSFTTLQLYENIMQANENLKEFSRMNESNSYSAMSASAILEKAIAAFPPTVAIQESRKIQGLPVNEDQIANTLKYEIAESLHRMLSREWITPVKNLCGYIAETMKNDKWGYVAANAMLSCSGKLQNNMYAALYEQLDKVLGSDDHYKSLFNLVTEQSFWSPECKNIVALMEKEMYQSGEKPLAKTVVENNNCTMVKVFSPVLENAGELTFNLWGKNYTFAGGKIMETAVSNERYNNVVNGLMLMSYNDTDKCFEYYGANGKVLEYDITNEKLHIGNQDLSELSSIDLANALRMSGLFERYNLAHADTLVRMFESREMITELDQCVNVKPETMAGVYLTIIAVEEGAYVNKVDFKHRINEMKFFPSATEARDYIKESVGYDASIILKEQLKREGDRMAAVAEKRNALKGDIAFLKEQRQTIVNKIENMPSNINIDELREAMNLLECEILNKEKELALCTVPCEGCVPMKLKNVVGELAIGSTVYVNAVAYGETPDGENITVIEPVSGAEVIVNKGDLVMDINEPHDDEVLAQPVMPTVPTPPTVMANGTGLVNDCNCNK